MMTVYQVCSWCKAKRSIVQVINGVKYRTCFVCFRAIRMGAAKRNKS